MITYNPDLAQYRMAHPNDSDEISGLYRQAYTPCRGGEPRDHYPFPQLLDPTTLVHLLTNKNVCWVVATCSNRVIGSAAAIRNIGSHEDRVAEVFGIVVDTRHQTKGVGTGLLEFLTHQLGNHPQVILCESRTALYAGWKVACNCGYEPIGFEPFGHKTPAGYEAMLMTGRVSRQALAQRTESCHLKGPLGRLATTVLGGFQSNNPLDPGVGEHRRELASRGPLPTMDPDKLVIRRDRAEGAAFLRTFDDQGAHDSGVIALRRLEGQDVHKQRYHDEYYIACFLGRTAAAIRYVWDELDCRVRICELRSIVDGMQSWLLTRVVDDLVHRVHDGHLTIVVDARADHPELQSTLLSLGFGPTVYYPSLIWSDGHRCDAVQFTLLINRSLEESLDFAAGIAWPSAQRVIRSVIRDAKHESRHHSDSLHPVPTSL